MSLRKSVQYNVISTMLEREKKYNSVTTKEDLEDQWYQKE